MNDERGAFRPATSDNSADAEPAGDRIDQPLDVGAGGAEAPTAGQTAGSAVGPGEGPAARPLGTGADAEVGWGWLQALAGLLLAIAPVLALTLLAQGSGGDPGSATPTTGAAFATVAVTVVIDAWYLFAAWIFSLRRTGAGLRGWGFRRPSRSIFWAVPLALVAVYAVSVVYNLLVQTEQQEIVESFPRDVPGTILFLLLACAVAPFFEETFFRGFLFQGFARSWGVLLGALASATVFSLSHQQLDIFVPLFALGLALVWVYRVSRSVWGSIALHAVYNGIAVIAWLAGG